MKNIKILFAALVVLSPFVLPNIITVPGNYSTIQAAINASVNGDTVRVEPGTYYENINFRGKRIVLTSRYYLTNDPGTISTTVINGSTPANPDTASCVIISSSEDSTTVLQGFTITGGAGTKWDDEHAPGNIYREGGGILIQYSFPIVQNNIITNNQATNTNGVVSAGGGGVRMGDSNPKFYNNIIMLNTARYGPGLVLNYSGGVFKNNVICLNTGGQNYSGGGGFWILGNASAGYQRVIENNTIVNNSAVQGTGGVLCMQTAVTIRNNIVRGNTSPGGSQILLSGSTAQVTYCNVEQAITGAGNINADPQFSDSSYVLSPGSPCVDKGDSSVIYNDPPDPNNTSLAKYPARGTIRNDMGAYGGPLSKLLTNAIIGIQPKLTDIPVVFSLGQNYPNPFNPVTKVRFDISELRFVKLTVYDALGREVSTLAGETLKPGTYEVEFNAGNLTSGIYFYTLSAGDLHLTKKMVLVK